MQKLQQLDLLLGEQHTHEPNTLYALGDVTRQVGAYSVSTRQPQ
jgi:hypothetical protein